MTTEVAIINREAIALAADSAVTVDMVNGRKIYNSANKVFALSNHSPVGIMVYGGAKFSGVPWESLIKVYRQENSRVSFGSLRQYADHFFSFLEENKSYFLDIDKQFDAYRFASLIYNNIKDAIRKETKKEFQGNAIIRSRENQMVNEKINEALKSFRYSMILPEFKSITISSLEDEYKKVFQEAIDHIFEELKITNQNNERLIKIASYALKSDSFPAGDYSGVVIAGFGEKEIIPDLVTYQVNLLLKGKIRKKILDEKSHNNRPHPILIPFAQEDVIFTFLTGISPELESVSRYVVNTEARKTINLFFEEIKKLGKLSDSEIKGLNAKIDLSIKSLANTHSQKMQDVKQKLYIEDILNIISVLPKEELAEMAESLVSLTSLRRKISIAEETVGGPTDVALISKGDGFIWIKRKHYFTAEMNPDFFTRKFEFYGMRGK